MTAQTDKSITSSSYPNDAFQLESPCMESILEGIKFWAKNTPDSVSIRYPPGPDTTSFESVTWKEYKDAVELAASWLQQTLQIPPSASVVSEKETDPQSSVAVGKRTITLLIAPSHDNMCLWMALASMGYSTQFISPAHVPSVIASLISRSQSRSVIFGGLENAWVQESQETRNEMVGTSASTLTEKPSWHELPEEVSFNGLLKRVRNGEKTSMPIPSDAPVPSPFVVLHSFGSTSTPKLYPLHLHSADLSAKDAGTWWIKTPTPARWRCQLQTSLPFHFSFQNPVWRALMCGTTLAFPVIRANANAAVSQASKGGVTLVPCASDVLDSLHLSKADVLYASPSGLEGMVQTAVHSTRPEWHSALHSLKEAHSGGAPTSFQMAETFSSNGLMVMQVFATTEAGMLFVGKPSLTGHLCHLTPRPQLKDKMLFYQPDSSNETLELWLPEDFPGLLKRDLKFESYPGDPSIRAWNTSDTFARIQGSSDAAPLFTFRGRTDDWLRLTCGTACRALEIESRLAQLLRDNGQSQSTATSAAQSPALTSGSISDSDSERSSQTSSRRPSAQDSLVTPPDSAGLSNSMLSSKSDSSYSRIQHVAALGNARKTLGVVVQLQDFAQPTEEEREAARRAAEVVTKEQLQYPAVLRPEAVVFATPEKPLNVTQKGSMQRKKNEESYGPVFTKLGIF